MTSCDAVRELLAEDGAEAVEAHADIQSHMEGCTSCTRLLNNLQAIDTGLKELPPHHMPDTLAADILQAVRAKGHNTTSSLQAPARRFHFGRLFDPLVLAASQSLQLGWRRKWQVIIPAFVLFVVSFVVAISWPPTYQSKATILIEEPEISGDFVQPVVAGYADQRVQVITQQVLSRHNLIKLIEKFDLYPEATDTSLLLAAAEGLRENINVAFISAEVNAPRMAGRRQATIAFTLSFNHKDPVIAQIVADELVSLYLAENSRSRQERASETTGFLAREADKLARQITELEASLAAFNELQLLELRHQIQSQEERKVYLDSQLSQISPYASITLDDGTVLRPEERLKKLESEYSRLSYTYGPKHPQMIEISTEIETLRDSIGVGSPETPSNPAYIQLKAESKAVNSSLNSLKAERAALSQRFESLEGQTLGAPEIEREFLLITRNYENATAEYRVVKEKLSEAERLQSLETERKGEHFSVIEPPELPLTPIAPNRRLIVLAGLFISLVGGFGTAAVIERMKTNNRDRTAQKQFRALLALLLVIVASALPGHHADGELDASTPAQRLYAQSVSSSGVHDGFAVLAQMDDRSGAQGQTLGGQEIRAVPGVGTNAENISFPRTVTGRAYGGILSLPPALLDGEMEYIRYLETKYGDVDKAMAIIGCKGQAPGAFYAVYRTGDFVRDGWCSHR